MKQIFYAYLIIIVVLSGCSSGKNTFERGNYYEAVITSVNRLRKNNDHKKSVETLRQAYPLAVSFHEDRAKTSLASNDRFKWTEVVKSYTFINNMYDEIKRCPGALAVIPNPINYFSKLQEARQNAAEEHYAAGILSLQGKTREDAKLAYGYFKTTNEYVAGYKEVNDYLQAALAAATVKILVEPIPVHSKSVGVSAEFFNDKISEFVHSAPISEFVRFYTTAEARKMKVTPDHIIQLQFDDFTVGEIYRHEKELQLSRDSVVMGSYVSPATASQTESKPAPAPANRSGLAANASGVLASTGTKVNTQPSVNSTAPVTNPTAEEERQKALAAEKLRLEREAVERERAAREAAERDRSAREAADREKAAKEAAEKDRAAKEASDRDRAAKEAIEKDRAAKEAAEREMAAKEAAEKALTDRTAAEKIRVENERAEKERLEREVLEKERAEKALADKLSAEKEKADRAQAEKEAAEQKAAAEKAKAERERAEKEKIEKEKLEKEKLDKEKLEREKIDKEKAGKDKFSDPTISADDTLNVQDGVLICHIPPGNKMNARTLKINRAALKAHLAHGDIEGGCEPEKNQEKGKPQDQPKGKPEPDNKDKNNKLKGPGGSASIDHRSKDYSFLQYDQHNLLASATSDPADILRYFEMNTLADTNKVYGTVKATLYHYTKTTTSKGIVSFRIIDAKTGALLSSEKMPGEFVWKSEWATFNGDERALSAEQLRLSRLKEVPAPAHQDLFIEFTRPIYDQITTKIREFYRNY